MMENQDFGKCAYPPRNPNGLCYPGGKSPRGTYGGRPLALGPIFNYICHCERIRRPSSSTEKTKLKKNIVTIDPQNEYSELNQEGNNKMFYWVINDPENTDPRVQDIVCIDSAENRPLKPAEVSKKQEPGKNEIYWEYVSDGKTDPKFEDAPGSDKQRSIKNRKPTGIIRRTHKLKKYLRDKLKENDLPDSSDEDDIKFDFPEEIREPQRGDLICWLGKSKGGPMPGVRAIWEAEEITEEPGKICWLGKEVSDRETSSAFRYVYKSSSGKHNWKSRIGYCLPPISSFKQKPINLIQRLTTMKHDNSATTQGKRNGSFDDDKNLQSISAYNIPSELLKTDSRQDFKTRNVTKSYNL